MRAIPWVFSWMQGRFNLPAWYGLGTALTGAGSLRPDAEASFVANAGGAMQGAGRPVPGDAGGPSQAPDAGPLTGDAPEVTPGGEPEQTGTPDAHPLPIGAPERAGRETEVPAPGAEPLTPDLPGESPGLPPTPGTTPEEPHLPGREPSEPDLPGREPELPPTPGTTPPEPHLPGQEPSEPHLPDEAPGEVPEPGLPGTEPSLPPTPGTTPPEPHLPGTEPTPGLPGTAPSEPGLPGVTPAEPHMPGSVPGSIPLPGASAAPRATVKAALRPEAPAGATADASGSVTPELLREMYQNWPFFRNLLDNAEMALLKADIGIAELYADLVPDEALRTRIFGQIKDEYERTREAVLSITGHDELLGDDPVIQRSVHLRNPYVDPLNYVQVEMLRRLRALPDPDGAEAGPLREVMVLTINGIAAGLRNTG